MGSLRLPCLQSPSPGSVTFHPPPLRRPAIAFRAAEDEERQRQAERKAAERRRVWEAAVERARERHSYRQRADALAEQVARWHEASEIRKYCDAVEAAHVSDGEVAKWISWSRSHADSLDPLRSPPHGPTPRPPASISELEPYLEGQGSL